MSVSKSLAPELLSSGAVLNGVADSSFYSTTWSASRSFRPDFGQSVPDNIAAIEFEASGSQTSFDATRAHVSIVSNGFIKAKPDSLLIHIKIVGHRPVSIRPHTNGTFDQYAPDGSTINQHLNAENLRDWLNTIGLKMDSRTPQLAKDMALVVTEVWEGRLKPVQPIANMRNGGIGSSNSSSGSGSRGLSNLLWVGWLIAWGIGVAIHIRRVHKMPIR